MLQGSKGPNVMSMMFGDKGPPIADVAKYDLDFNRQLLPINMEGLDKITLTQKSSEGTCKNLINKYINIFFT